MIQTYTDFITQVEGVYGVYNPALKAELAMYLPAKVKQEDLQSLYWRIREEYTTAYKTPPDLTQIHALLKKSDRDYEAEAHEWWNTITRTGCSLDDVVISDLRAQACIEDFGGWAEFCQRDPQYESLHQQKFTKWFVMYSHKLPDREAKVLLGDSTRRREPLMFGLKDECKAIAMSARPEGSVLQLADTLTRDMRIGNEH